MFFFVTAMHKLSKIELSTKVNRVDVLNYGLSTFEFPRAFNALPKFPFQMDLHIMFFGSIDR